MVTQRSLNTECGVNRPSGRVLVRDRRAKQRHQPITTILVNTALEPMNFRCDQFETAPYNVMDVLRIELLGHSSKSSKIAEQNCDLAAFALPWRVFGPNFFC